MAPLPHAPGRVAEDLRWSPSGQGYADVSKGGRVPPKSPSRFARVSKIALPRRFGASRSFGPAGSRRPPSRRPAWRHPALAPTQRPGERRRKTAMPTVVSTLSPMLGPVLESNGLPIYTVRNSSARRGGPRASVEAGPCLAPRDYGGRFTAPGAFSTSRSPRWTGRACGGALDGVGRRRAEDAGDQFSFLGYGGSGYGTRAIECPVWAVAPKSRTSSWRSGGTG